MRYRQSAIILEIRWWPLVDDGLRQVMEETCKERRDASCQCSDLAVPLPGIRVLHVLADNSHDGEERHREDHAHDPPQRRPEGQGEEDDDGVQLHATPEEGGVL